MKHILTLTLILITISLFIFSFKQSREISYLKSNLNQTNSILNKHINKDTTLNKNALTQEFKEDYYIIQQQLNQEQIITFVSLLFGILFFIGVGIFINYLTNLRQELYTKSENDWKDYEKKQIEITEKQIELGLNFANTVITTAESLKGVNNFNYVFQTLMGLANYKFYGYQSNDKEQIDKIILGQLKLMNMEVSEIITSNQPSRNLIWNYLSQLTSIRNREITDEVNKLRSKINDQ